MILESLTNSRIDTTSIQLDFPSLQMRGRLNLERDIPARAWEQVQPDGVTDPYIFEKAKVIILSRSTSNPLDPSDVLLEKFKKALINYDPEINSNIMTERMLTYSALYKLLVPNQGVTLDPLIYDKACVSLLFYMRHAWDTNVFGSDLHLAVPIAALIKISNPNERIAESFLPEHHEKLHNEFNKRISQEEYYVKSVEELELAAYYRILFPDNEPLLTPKDTFYQKTKKNCIERVNSNAEDTDILSYSFNYIFPLAIIGADSASLNESGLVLQFNQNQTLSANAVPLERKF